MQDQTTRSCPIPSRRGDPFCYTPIALDREAREAAEGSWEYVNVFRYEMVFRTGEGIGARFFVSIVVRFVSDIFFY